MLIRDDNDTRSSTDKHGSSNEARVMYVDKKATPESNILFSEKMRICGDSIGVTMLPLDARFS